MPSLTTSASSRDTRGVRRSNAVQARIRRPSKHHTSTVIEHQPRCPASRAPRESPGDAERWQRVVSLREVISTLERRCPDRQTGDTYDSGWKKRRVSSNMTTLCSRTTRDDTNYPSPHSRKDFRRQWSSPRSEDACRRDESTQGTRMDSPMETAERGHIGSQRISTAHVTSQRNILQIDRSMSLSYILTDTSHEDSPIIRPPK